MWWDRQINVGQTWVQAIEDQLSNARCVVVLWSENSVESDWVIEKAAYAKELGKLIPVMIDNVQPPLGFRSIQSPDLVDWDGNPNHPRFRELIQAITSIAESPRKGRKK